MREEYPPQTPCWWAPRRSFRSTAFWSLKVISTELATAKRRSFSAKVFWSQPVAVADASWTRSCPAYTKRPSPQWVALFRTTRFLEQPSNMRIPAESCPRQYEPWL